MALPTLLLAVALSAPTMSAELDLTTVLSPEQVGRDLDELRRVIEKEWLLSNTTPADYPKAMAAIRARGKLTTADFALDVQKLLALSGDGHARVSQLEAAMRAVSPRQLPFTAEVVGGRYVAVDPSNLRRNQLWRPDYPYLVAVDGQPIDRWVAAAVPYLPQAHPLAVRAGGCHLLRYAGFLRTRLGLPDAPAFRVELESAEGKRVTVPVPDAGRAQETPFKYNKFLHTADGDRGWAVLDGNVGYVHMSGAPDRIVRRLIDGMPKLRETSGLVLDFRENEGGAGGDVLNLLGAWFTGPGYPRHVAGVDRRRTDKPVAANFFVYGAASPEVTADGRRLLGRALGEPRGRWQAPAGLPTVDRAVLLAAPAAEPGILPYSHPKFAELVPPAATYHYRQPVAVLVDRHCLSSAELVAAGLQGLPHVTVVGERTRGGTGAARQFPLPASKLAVSLACDAVFIPADGSPIDGRGIVPDAQADLDLTTVSGPGDAMLGRAVSEVLFAAARPKGGPR